MSDGFLSQEEIDLLLNGGDKAKEEGNNEELISDLDKDVLGEVGNISMGSASTALSTIINQPVNITTPVVSVTSLKELKNKFEVPNIALDVKYISGIEGENLLVMKITDAGVIANLMMGGDGKVETETLSEIEISAVSEAMNQMIGSAATSMATMFSREVNISPPNCKIWDDKTEGLAESISDDESIVQVSFRLIIGDIIDSFITQILPVSTAKKIVGIMTGASDEPAEASAPVQAPKQETPSPSYDPAPTYSEPEPAYTSKEIERPNVEVQKAAFKPLSDKDSKSTHRNIDLILDVPLEISVVLGRTKRNVRDILSFGTGSLIELDKLAEEPVEIMVNGKKVAYGEVVVVDENFAVRITSIVSSAERVKSLG